MVVMSERTGGAPEAVEVVGREVWMRRSIVESERVEQLGDGEAGKVTVYAYEELHFTDPAGSLTAAGVKADFDEVWAAHEADGMSMEEQVEALKQRLAESDAALMELGDLIGGDE